VDSLHIDEELPVNWEEIALRAEFSGLLGAVQIRLERLGSKMRTQVRIVGISIERSGSDTGREPMASDNTRSNKVMTSSKSQKQSRWRTTREDPKSQADSKQETRTKRRRRSRIKLSDARRLLPEATWLLNKAWRRLKLRVRGSLVYGFPDPFATGLTHGLMATLPPLSQLYLQPDYSQGRLDGWVELSLRIYPIQVLFLAVQACFRPGIRPLWWPRVRSWILPRRTKEAM